MPICYGAIGRAGGFYTALEPYPDRHKTRKAIRDDWVMALSIYGKQVKLDGVYGREESPEDYAFGKEWFGIVQGTLDQGQLRAHPIVVDGGEGGKSGFEGVLEGVGRIRHKGMSGGKMVYRLA